MFTQGIAQEIANLNYYHYHLYFLYNYRRKSLLPHPVNRSSASNVMHISPNMDKSSEYTNIQVKLY